MRKSLLHRRVKHNWSKKFLVAGSPCWIRLFLVVSTTLLIVIWAGAASVLVWLPSSLLRGGTSASSRFHRRTSGEDTSDTSSFPKAVDLWPSDNDITDNANLALLHKSCFNEDVENSNKCQSRSDTNNYGGEDNLAPRVAVLRTPGIIGRSLGQIVEQSLFNYTSDSSIELYVTNKVDDVIQNQYTKLVRLVTFPILLEALDLALQSSTSYDQITLSDVIQVAKLVARWHCHVSLVADHWSLLTISASTMLAHPSEARKLLIWFLQVNNEEMKYKDLNEWMDPIAHQVLHRIGQCSAVAMRIQQQQQNHDMDLERLVDAAILDEIEQCTTESATQRTFTTTITDSSSSLLVEIAGLLLSVDENYFYRDTSSLCQQFRSIEFCRDNAPEAVS